MRRLALVLLVGFICLAAGFYAGSAMCQRGRTASGQAALQRASEALTVGRRDEALEYAFAALDRNPDLYQPTRWLVTPSQRSGAMSWRATSTVRRSVELARMAARESRRSSPP